jgi:hypothetical protein
VRAATPARVWAATPPRVPRGIPARIAAAAVVAVAVLAAAGVAARPAAAVVAGDEVDPADHPAVVRLAQACTATLVAPRRLLTAGHCISRVVPGTSTVRIAGERFVAVRVARHPRYQYLTPDYPAEPYRDVALVELDRPSGVRPVRVSRRAVRAGTRVVLYGYGTGRADQPGSYGVLRRASLVVRSAAVCRDRLERAGRGQGGMYRDAVMLCTQDPDGERPFASGCYGDSGGPLLRARRGSPAVLVGTDSWGVACGARGGDPEVFARAAAEWRFVRAVDPGWTTTPIQEPFAPGRF